jgi:hypothetical protein
MTQEKKDEIIDKWEKTHIVNREVFGRYLDWEEEVRNNAMKDFFDLITKGEIAQR